MMTIEISIGPTGLTLPVTFARLVRTHLGGDLSNAKRVLDTLAEQRIVTLNFADRAAGLAFCHEVELIGLNAREL